MASNLPDDIDLVSRIACFGSEDGTFNVLNKEYQVGSADLIKSTLRERGKQVVKRLKTIATRKCYAKKENILYSLAATINAFGVDGAEHSTDSLCTQVYKLVEGLCESPSDLFNFIYFDKEIRNMKTKTSWGRGMRTLVANFYSSKSPDVLAHQITQCKSGHGFSHRDLMRLIHIPCDKTTSKGTTLVLNYALRGKVALEKMEASGEGGDGTNEDFDKALAILKSVERLRETQDTEKEVIRSLIETNNLAEKQIPSHFFRLREAFEGLLGHMTLAFMVKSVPKMAELGMLDSASKETMKVTDRLKSAEAFEQERVSPVTVFVAQRKYDMNRLKKWIRNPQVVQSLKTAYEHSLNNIPTTNKRYLLACHIDDKTISKTCVTGTSCMSPTIPCVIIGQILARTENNPELIYIRQNSTVELELSKDIPSVALLEQILKETKEPSNEEYDLCEPFRWAVEKRKAFDCIVVIVSKKRVTSIDDLKAAINHYRVECGVPHAKVVIVGLSGPVCIPNREDLNFLDVTGFDDEVLSLIQAFFRGLPQGDDDSVDE